MARGHWYAIAARVNLALLSVAATGRAQSVAAERVDAGVHLSWVRAAGATECGNAGLVQADVVRRLGKNPFTEPSRVFVEAVASRDGALFQAQLDLRDENGGPLGARKVTSDAPTCDSLVSAAGLAIALMIDPDAALAPKTAPPPPPPVLAPPPPPITASLPDRPRSERRGQGVLSAALVGAVRMLPRAALGVRIGGQVKLGRRLDGELSLTFLPEQREQLHGFDVSFGLTYASAGLCYRLLEAATVQLSGCGFVSGGQLHVATHDPARSRTGQLFWSAGGLGLRAEWVLASPLVMRAGVEGSVPFERRDYLMWRGISNAVVVFSDSAFAATLHVGLGARF